MYKVRCIDDRWIGLYGYYLGQFFQGHIYMGERGTGIFPKHQFLKFNLFSFFPLHIRQSCWSGLVVPSSSPTPFQKLHVCYVCSNIRSWFLQKYEDVEKSN